MPANWGLRRRIANLVKYHFTILDNGGKCRYCPMVISMPANSSGNLKRHLKSKHPDVYREEYEAVSRTRASSTDAEIREIVSYEPPSLMPASITEKVSDSVMQESMEVSLPRPSKTYSPTWNHFTRMGKKWKCHYCSREVTPYQGSASNLKRHLKKYHPTVVSDLCEPERQPSVPPGAAEVQEIISQESFPLITTATSEEVQPRIKQDLKTEPLSDEARGALPNENNITDRPSEAAEDIFCKFVGSELLQMCSEIRQETKANIILALSQGMRKQSALASNRIPQTDRRNFSSLSSPGAGLSHSFFSARTSPVTIKEEPDFSESSQNFVYTAYSDTSD